MHDGILNHLQRWASALLFVAWQVMHTVQKSLTYHKISTKI